MGTMLAGAAFSGLFPDLSIYSSLHVLLACFLVQGVLGPAEPRGGARLGP